MKEDYKDKAKVLDNRDKRDKNTSISSIININKSLSRNYKDRY